MSSVWRASKSSTISHILLFTDKVVPYSSLKYSIGTFSTVSFHKVSLKPRYKLFDYSNPDRALLPWPKQYKIFLLVESVSLFLTISGSQSQQYGVNFPVAEGGTGPRVSSIWAVTAFSAVAPLSVPGSFSCAILITNMF